MINLDTSRDTNVILIFDDYEIETTFYVYMTYPITIIGNFAGYLMGKTREK